MYSPPLPLNVPQTVPFSILVVLIWVPGLAKAISNVSPGSPSILLTIRLSIVALSFRCFFSSDFRSRFSRRAAMRYSCRRFFLSNSLAGICQSAARSPQLQLNPYCSDLGILAQRPVHLGRSTWFVLLLYASCGGEYYEEFHCKREVELGGAADRTAQRTSNHCDHVV